MNFGTRMFRFLYSKLYHLLWPWGSYLTLASFNFLFCKMRKNVETITYRVSARIEWINKCKTNTFLPCMQYMLYNPFPIVMIIIVRIDFVWFGFFWDCEVGSGENRKHHLLENVPMFSYSSFVLITFNPNYYVSLGINYHTWLSFLSVLRYYIHQHWVLWEWNWDWWIKGFFIF